MVALVLFQRATGRELWHLALPGQASDKSTRDALLDLQEAGKARPDGWARGRKLWCLTKAGHKEAARLLPPGSKLSTVREEKSAGYDEHALDVVATAGHLTRAGHGSPLTLTTEVRHALPGRTARYADLVLRDPGADVPVLLVEVDRDNETVGQLVEKLATYCSPRAPTRPGRKPPGTTGPPSTTTGTGAPPTRPPATRATHPSPWSSPQAADATAPAPGPSPPSSRPRRPNATTSGCCAASTRWRPAPPPSGVRGRTRTRG